MKGVLEVLHTKIAGDGDFEGRHQGEGLDGRVGSVSRIKRLRKPKMMQHDRRRKEAVDMKAKHVKM